MTPLRIGIDFDNTIVSYEGVFYTVALEKKWIPPELPPSKGSVRDYLHAQEKQEAWTELQGTIYGARMDLAHPYPGIASFFALCMQQQIPVFIISHKTLHPFLGPPYHLHQAARTWLDKQAFAGPPPAFFELTLEEKLQRISKQQCSVFIDDLPEVLSEKNFPHQTQKILFDPHRLYSPSQAYHYATSWDEIRIILKMPTHGP